MPADAPPLVSLLVPCRNEAAYIEDCLRALLAQDYPHHRLEIVLADACSEDGSAALARTVLDGSDVAYRIVDNPERTTPAGLNAALAAARGDVVVYVIVHGELSPDYVRLAVEVLDETGADCVGGTITTTARTPAGEAAALALSSRFGVGGVAFRTRPGYAGPADTAAFGAYRRAVFDRIGAFDPDFHRNVDSELSYRLLRAGGSIHLDPTLRATYYCRESLAGLWSQYHATGASKVAILAKHGSLPSWRHWAPGAFVAGLAASVLATALLRRPGPAAAVAGPYAVALTAAASAAAPGRPRLISRVAAAMATLHLAYGTGFLIGLWRRFVRGRPVGASSDQPAASSARR